MRSNKSFASDSQLSLWKKPRLITDKRWSDFFRGKLYQAIDEIHRGHTSWNIRALGAGHDVSKDHQTRCGLSRNPDAHTTWTFKPLTVYTVMASSPLRTAMSHLADSERESRNRVQGFYNLFHCVESFSQPCPAPLACVARLNDGRPACMPLCFLVVPSRGWASRDVATGNSASQKVILCSRVL